MYDTNNDTNTPQSEGCAAGGPSHREGSGMGRIESEDYYLNEKGLLTFTAKYLLERGYCCGNGCRHCPFDYEAVPEPKRSYLLAQRNKRTNEQ